MRTTRRPTPRPSQGYVLPTQHEAFAAVRQRPTGGVGRVVRRRILWFLGLAAAVAGSYAVFASPALDVRRVEVQGLAGFLPHEAAAILRDSALPSRTSYVRLPAAEVRRRLERQPWVAAATVKRGWPTTVRVAVRPRIAVVDLQKDGATWQVDATATPIRTIAAPAGRPILTSANVVDIKAGQPLSDPETQEAVRIVANGGIPDAPRIAKIVVDPSGELCLNMVDGVTVQLGHVDGLRDKLALVRRIYRSDRAIAATVATISVRYPQAPVCALRKPASDTSPSAAATVSRNRRAQSPSTAKTP